MYFAYAMTDSDKQRVVIGSIVSEIISGSDVMYQNKRLVTLNFVIACTTLLQRLECSVLYFRK